jgi:hypothetical protein
MTPQSPTYKPTIRYKGGTRYDVQSRTRPDHVHHVDTYRLTCTCEAAQYGKRCWALAAALQYEAWRRHEQAKAQHVHPNNSEFHRSAGYKGLSECF